MNLLLETHSAIVDSGHTLADIIFIGSEESGHQCTWDEFEKLADCEYDDGFGSAEVAQDLIFVFADGIKLKRGGYDGSEWWEYSTPFKRPETKEKIMSLFTSEIGWNSLSECQKVSTDL